MCKKSPAKKSTSTKTRCEIQREMEEAEDQRRNILIDNLILNEQLYLQKRYHYLQMEDTKREFEVHGQWSFLKVWSPRSIENFQQFSKLKNPSACFSNSFIFAVTLVDDILKAGGPNLDAEDPSLICLRVTFKTDLDRLTKDGQYDTLGICGTETPFDNGEESNQNYQLQVIGGLSDVCDKLVELGDILFIWGVKKINPYPRPLTAVQQTNQILRIDSSELPENENVTVVLFRPMDSINPTEIIFSENQLFLVPNANTSLTVNTEWLDNLPLSHTLKVTPVFEKKSNEPPLRRLPGGFISESQNSQPSLWPAFRNNESPQVFRSLVRGNPNLSGSKGIVLGNSESFSQKTSENSIVLVTPEECVRGSAASSKSSTSISSWNSSHHAPEASSPSISLKLPSRSPWMKDNMEIEEIQAVSEDKELLQNEQNFQRNSEENHQPATSLLKPSSVSFTSYRQQKDQMEEERRRDLEREQLTSQILHNLFETQSQNMQNKNPNARGQEIFQNTVKDLLTQVSLNDISEKEECDKHPKVSNINQDSNHNETALLPAPSLSNVEFDCFASQMLEDDRILQNKKSSIMGEKASSVSSQKRVSGSLPILSNSLKTSLQNKSGKNLLNNNNEQLEEFPTHTSEGCIQNMENDKDKDEQSSFLEQILNCSQLSLTLNELISQELRYSPPKAIYVKAEPDSPPVVKKLKFCEISQENVFNLHCTVIEMYKTHKARIREDDIGYLVVDDGTLPNFITTEPSNPESQLDNLLLITQSSSIKVTNYSFVAPLVTIGEQMMLYSVKRKRNTKGIYKFIMNGQKTAQMYQAKQLLEDDDAATQPIPTGRNRCQPSLTKSSISVPSEDLEVEESRQPSEKPSVSSFIPSRYVKQTDSVDKSTGILVTKNRGNVLTKKREASKSVAGLESKSKTSNSPKRPRYVTRHNTRLLKEIRLKEQKKKYNIRECSVVVERLRRVQLLEVQGKQDPEKAMDFVEEEEIIII